MTSTRGIRTLVYTRTSGSPNFQFIMIVSNTSLYDENELASVTCISAFGLAMHTINSSLGKLDIRSIGLGYSGLTLIYIPLSLAQYMPSALYKASAYLVSSFSDQLRSIGLGCSIGVQAVPDQQPRVS